MMPWIGSAFRRTVMTVAVAAAGMFWFFHRIEMPFEQVVWTRRWLLWLAVTLPIIVAAASAYMRRSHGTLLLPTARVLPSSTSWRRGFDELASALALGALSLSLLALARPYDPVSESRSEDSGIDIMVVLDMSLSMNAVLDDSTNRRIVKADGLEHKATRLDVAKEVIIDFAHKRPHDRIGGVVFGPDAYLLCPPTLDKRLFTDLIGKLELGMISGEGTSIGDGVGTAVARLRHSTAPSKVVVLLTDGDNTTGKYAPEHAARLALGAGAKVYTIQIGDGDMVDVEDGNDLAGRIRYRKVKFPVNPVLLQKMSDLSGGQSFVASKREDLEASMHAILNQLATTKFVTEEIRVVELFPVAIFVAAVLMVLAGLFRAVVRRFP